MSSLSPRTSDPETDVLVPQLDLSNGMPDPVAIATWHMALDSLVGTEIPHQLLAVWVFPESGGAVLLGPEALAHDRLDIPEPEPFLAQDQLFELEDALRRATYASAVAIPVHGAERDVGLALIGTFQAGAYDAAQIRRLKRLGSSLRSTLEPLSRMLRGRAAGADTSIAPRVGNEELPAELARVISEAASGQELVRQLSGLLHAHLPHDRLELLAFANGSGTALPLSGATPRRRWGTGGRTWGDLVRLVDELRGKCRTASIADLGAEAPGLGWPGGGGAGPAKVASVLAAVLELGDQPVGMLFVGHAAGDVYRPADEELVDLVARLVSARVAAFRLESEVEALRGQLEVLEAPALPVLRAIEALASTAHLGLALHRFGAEVGELVPHERLRFLLRWSDTEVVTLSADAIRPLPDLPLTPIETLAARPVLEGDRRWVLSQGENGVELAVPLEVADRRVGAMVIDARTLASPREAAAALHQFAAVVAPHLELVRRSALGPGVRPPRPAGEPARRPEG
jgi:hypothetical protein